MDKWKDSNAQPGQKQQPQQQQPCKQPAGGDKSNQKQHKDGGCGCK